MHDGLSKNKIIRAEKSIKTRSEFNTHKDDKLYQYPTTKKKSGIIFIYEFNNYSLREFVINLFVISSAKSRYYRDKLNCLWKLLAVCDSTRKCSDITKTSAAHSGHFVWISRSLLMIQKFMEHFFFLRNCFVILIFIMEENGFADVP